MFGMNMSCKRAWRTKTAVDQSLTDRELFSGLAMGDCWPESEVAQVFFYLYRSSTTEVPDSWAATMASFAHELEQETCPSAEALALYNDAVAAAAAAASTFGPP